MKKRTKTSHVLEILLGVYALGYLGLFILPLFSANTAANEVPLIELITVPLAFVIFLAGFGFCWYDERIAGFILLIWHFLVWMLALFAWENAGMVLVLSFPVFILAVLLIQNWYINYDKAFTDVSRRWKLVLQVMLVNYALLYLLVVVSQFIKPAPWNYMSAPGVILLLALALFLIGFALTWTREMIAGILLIVWYSLVLLTSINYFEFQNSGPSTLFGLTILVHGVLYIIYYIRFKSHQEGKHVI